MTRFKLTDKDITTLKDWGYEDRDMAQIEEGANVGKITFTNRNRTSERDVSPTEAKRMLGRTEFLSGLSRSAFHWSAI